MSMSAEQTARGASLILMVLGCSAALPGRACADDELPDMALLEYLGSWEESDEDWVLFNEDEEQAGTEEQQGDAAAAGDPSQESDDER
ncbi:MAG: hypothetical protein WBN23_07120 [Woeseia sp.]